MSASSRDRVEFFIEAEAETEPRLERGEDEPFRLALLGDFSGAAERKPLAQRRPVLIDRDNFEELLARFRPVASVPAGSVAFIEMDDFHPDNIYSRLPVFDALRETRNRLENPSTFAEAARDLLGPAAPVPQAAAAPPKAGDDLIEQLLSEAATAPKRALADDDLKSFVQQAVRPYLVQRPDPRAPEMIRQVDEAAAGLMRDIIHDQAFQSLEAAWRTALTVVRTLETGTDLKVYLFDVSKEELRSDPQGVLELFAQRSEPLGVIGCALAFGTDDIPVLRTLSRIASKTGAPVLAEGDLSLLDGDAVWLEFRRSAEAKHIGLAIPRVLLRLPYGNDTIPCERFAFEEISGKPDPKRMLWGTPGPFCAMLIAQAFEQSGYSLRPGAVRDIGGLPVYVYKEDGETLALPCAEVELTEDAAEALAQNGFMPVASIRNHDAVRVLRFQSVADPPTALAGRWQ